MKVGMNVLSCSLSRNSNSKYIESHMCSQGYGRNIYNFLNNREPLKNALIDHWLKDKYFEV